ncbi:MAG: hypothetical protein KBC81_02920 [Candidatus Pacebacteria bacterium]|nr:hypothetical protein [Candidatus Paceibacterota bacterium]
MRLGREDHIAKQWRYSNNSVNGVNVILMRHGPKSGSNNSGLSDPGAMITQQYGRLLCREFGVVWAASNGMYHTEKRRTRDTLSLMFPFLNQENFGTMALLNSQAISAGLQEQVNRLHLERGRWLGYYLNHTYCLLESLGGVFPADSPEDCLPFIADEAARGIKQLGSVEDNGKILFCGHSPKIELGVAKLLGVSILELGGFLNPLDSIHLRIVDGHATWVSRINPIVGYIDAESESCMDLK